MYEPQADHTMLARSLAALHRSTRRSTAALSTAPYGRLDADDLAAFRSIVAGPHVLTDTAAHSTDWLGQTSHPAAAVVQPKTTAEVSRVLAHCHRRRLAVVPQGGNTGLVGGSVPTPHLDADQVVLSLSRMDAVLAMDDVSGVVACEAGTVLDRLAAYLGRRGRCAPLDLGASGSCQLGGNLATNAGGVRYVRHGPLRASVVGVEAVLADGRVVGSAARRGGVRKDNTGYVVEKTPSCCLLRLLAHSPRLS